MYASLHHYVFLHLTFMSLSIPSSLLAEGIAITKIGRADIEGSKSKVAMNACAATQAWLSLWVMGGLGRGQEGGYQDVLLKIYIEKR